MAYIKLLKDVPLDNNYVNPILFGFDTQNLPTGFTRVNYNNFFTKFENNWKPSATNGLKMNIKVGDGINTTIIVPEEQWQPSYNYAIIKFEDNEIKPCSYDDVLSGNEHLFFYFITNCVPLGRGNYAITLELDVLTTYLPYLKLDHKIFTERKHCNRWKNKSGNYMLDYKDAILGDNIDAMFNATLINKRIKPLMYKYVNLASCEGEGDYENINQELTNFQWVYLFFTELPIKTGQLDLTNIDTLKYSNANGNVIDSKLYCIAFPTRDIIIKEIRDEGEWRRYDDRHYGINYNNFRIISQQPSCVGAKLSNRSPFVLTINYPNEEITTGYYRGIRYNNKIELHVATHFNLNDTYVDDNWKNLKYIVTDVKYGSSQEFNGAYIVVTELPTSYIESTPIDLSNEINLPYTIKSGVEYIVNAYKLDRNIRYEPKLYCKPFYNLRLYSQYGLSYNYNPLLFESNEVVLSMYNAITPESEKIYCYVAKGVYSYYKECNIGSTMSYDNNIPFRQDAYLEYLSRHKASVVSGLVMPIVNGVTNSALSIAGSQLKEGGLGKNASGMVTGVGSSVLETGNELVNYFTNIADLQNTPDSIKNMGNNPIHDFVMGNDTHPYFVEEVLFDNEKQQVFDYFYDNGYKVNRKCNIDFNNFSNTEQIITRQKFNYIKIKENFVNEMKFELYTDNELRWILYIPQLAKQKINSIFNRGLKLWTLIYRNVTGATWEDFYLGSDFENAEIVLP